MLLEAVKGFFLTFIALECLLLKKNNVKTSVSL